MTVRLAWHAAGTFDKRDGSGGSDGAHMRFQPEAGDGANAGLSIIQDLLKPVKAKHPHLSVADIWTLAGASAVNFLGGPEVPHRLGRVDDPDNRRCPAPGRLPDASQGAAHLREVFGRMGFNDQEIVALSGAHTLGRCHVVRSGYDGPWTRNPLRFDNQYFRNLLQLEWREKKWDGPRQFEDVLTGELMMLPTDMALRDDPAFRKYAEAYAADEQLFFRDFAAAYGRLLALGCPGECDPGKVQRRAAMSASEEAGAAFRENAMHGSVAMLRKYAPQCDVHACDPITRRNALHKAAFWGHIDATRFLVQELHLDLHARDSAGDTPAHDAARFGHRAVLQLLLAAGADPSLRNNSRQTVGDVAAAYGYPDLLGGAKM